MAFQFMACRGLRSSLFIFFVIFGGASVFLFSWFSGRAFGQESDSKTTHCSVRERDGDRPYLRDRLDWNWNQRDRSLLRGESAAGLRFRAYNHEDGNAGGARGCEWEFYIPRCAVLYIPSQVELGWGSRFSLGFYCVGPGGAGSARFRRYGRWSARLSLGLGARHFYIDRSCGHDGKHGAAGRRLWAGFGSPRTRAVRIPIRLWSPGRL